MSKLILKINVKVPQLLCIVVSVALNGESERFGGFCVDRLYSQFLYILPYISLYFEQQTDTLFVWVVGLYGW